MRLYRIGEFRSTNDFLLQIAEKQGKVKKGGVLDMEKAARTVLEDWNSGRIPYYTVPDPEEVTGDHISSEIVTEWAASFDIDSLVEREEEDIQVLDEPNADGLIEMTSAGPDTGALPTYGRDDQEDGEAAMEADEEKAAAVEMHMSSRQKLGTRRQDGGVAAVGVEDGMSQNRDRKKALKAAKKGERRAYTQVDDGESAGADEDFDFDQAGFGQQEAPMEGSDEETNAADGTVDMVDEDDYGFDSDDM
jgi:nuclear GTP-binding protein